MTEQTEDQKPKTKLSLSKPGRLELKKTIEAGQVRQSFSHGRSKAVTVEVRRKRTFTQAADGGMTEIKKSDQILAEATATAAAEQALLDEADVQVADEAVRKAQILRELTEEERAARARALFGAKRADVVAEEEMLLTREREAEAEAQRRVEEEARRREDEERRQADAETARQASEQASRLEAQAAKAGDPAKPETRARNAVPAVEEPSEEDTDKKPDRGRRVSRPDQRRLTAKRTEPRRRSGKLTMAQALSDEERSRSLASLRRSRERDKRAMQRSGEAVKVVREVVVPETITIQELANRMAERAGDVIKALMKMGVMVTITQSIEADTAELVVNEFGHRIKRVSEADVEIGLEGEEDSQEQLESRPPVVTVMGHVDHGKTSLLDALRSTNVVAGEAGGITQHIGAYQVTLASGDKITFIDTPGHEAFTAMRARGADCTDLIILVVAADDGIMPQTVEAIDHAKAAGVPIIVAINKIDLPDADPTRVRNELLQHELVLEELGGEILSVEVSATEKTNLDKLEEAIVLQSEILEITANPDRAAAGVVIEARLERGRGAVATLLVQRGTLHLGDIVVAGQEWGHVRAMNGDAGDVLDAATPSVPVEVLGLSAAPMAGDEFAVVDSEVRAREITEFRARRERDRRVSASPRSSLEQMFSKLGGGEFRELPLVIKADAQGSIEAIQASLEKFTTDEVGVRVLHSGVGGINESDVTLAGASSGLVIGFNVRANPQARGQASAAKTDIRYYSVIYQVIDDIKAMLTGMLKPARRENFLGNATIQEVFNITKVGKIAGCRVTEGVVKRGASVRLLRDDVVIHEGLLGTLKHFKDEVREVRAGTECGMAFESYHDLRANDVIECFEVEHVARTL